MKKLILIFAGAVSLFALSCEDAAKKSYEIMSGYKSSISKTTMILKNANGDENIRKMEIQKLENIEGDKSLINFLYPNDLKDTKLLSYEVLGGDDQQWLYLSALKRTKRISSRNKSGSFMASEFSYEDISSQNYKNYSYNGEALKVTIEGKNYLQIQRIPKDKNSGYKRQVVYLEEESFLARFGEYYDLQDRLLKKINFEKYKMVEGIYRIEKIVMQNVQNDKTSILIWDEDIIFQNLNDKDFEKRVLQ